jgi:hypothetical protein
MTARLIEAIGLDGDSELQYCVDLSNRTKSETGSSSFHLLTGGLITINGSNPAQFDISAGSAIYVNNSTDPQNPTYKVFSWGAMIGMSTVFLANYPDSIVSLNSDGVLVFHTPDTIIRYTEVHRVFLILGRINHPNNTSITSVSPAVYSPPIDIGLALADFAHTVGAISSGNVVSGVAGQLQIQKALGTFFNLGSNWFSSKQRPNKLQMNASNPVSFSYAWQSGNANLWKTTAATTILNPARYDTNVTGTTTQPNGVVPNNSWTIQRGWLLPNNTMFIQYGQATYLSYAEAVDGIYTEAFVAHPSTQYNMAPLVYILMQGNCTSTTDTTRCKIIMAGKFGGAASSSAITTLQQAYENGASPELKVNTARGALTIQDADAPLNAPILEVLSSNAASSLFSVGSTGQLLAPSIHNNPSPHLPVGEVASGNYTPTASVVANLSQIVIRTNSFLWTRVGQVVSVSGQATITATAGGGTPTGFDLTLPIASNLINTDDATGVVNWIYTGNTVLSNISLVGNATTDRVNISFNSGASNAGVAMPVSIFFRYEVK